jgi:hypothetical protein
MPALAPSAPVPTDDVLMQPTEAASELPNKELRYWRERRAAAARAGDLGTADVTECDARIASFELRTRAARPWVARVQAAADVHKAAESRFAAAEQDLAAARAAVLHFDGQVAEARAAAAAAEADLASVRAEGAPGTAAAHRAEVPPDVAVAALRAAADAAGTTLEAFLAALLAPAGGPAAAMGSVGGMLASGGGQHGAVAAEGARSAEGAQPDAAGTHSAQPAGFVDRLAGGIGDRGRAAAAARAGSEPRSRVSGYRGTSPASVWDGGEEDGDGRSRSAQRRARDAEIAATSREVQRGRQATLDGFIRRPAAA